MTIRSSYMGAQWRQLKYETAGLAAESVEKGKDMMLQLKQGASVENPRQYESEAIKQLRQLLESGTPAQRDPQRKNLYEIDSSNEIFYIYMSPISGTVVLLAKWISKSQECCMSAGEMVA